MGIINILSEGVGVPSRDGRKALSSSGA